MTTGYLVVESFESTFEDWFLQQISRQSMLDFSKMFLFVDVMRAKDDSKHVMRRNNGSKNKIKNSYWNDQMKMDDVVSKKINAAMSRGHKYEIYDHQVDGIRLKDNRDTDTIFIQLIYKVDSKDGPGHLVLTEAKRPLSDILHPKTDRI